MDTKIIYMKMSDIERYDLEKATIVDRAETSVIAIFDNLGLNGDETLEVVFTDRDL